MSDMKTCLEKASGKSDALKKKAALGIKWLDDLTASTRKWAATYTWGLNTLGANASQRAEAIFSGLKSNVHNALTLIEACQEVESYNSKRIERLALERRRREYRGRRQKKAKLPRFMQGLLAQLTPYAYHLQLDQYYLTMTYKIDGPLDFKSTHFCGRWLLGRRVVKDFEGKPYAGTIVKSDTGSRYFKVKYDDGDEEELTLKAVKKGLRAYYNETGARSGEADEARTGEGNSPTHAAHASAAEVFVITPADEPKVDDDNSVYKEEETPLVARLLEWGLGEVFGLGHKGKRFTSLYFCTCRFREHWGLLCRHILRVWFRLDSKVSSIPLSLISSHWLHQHWHPPIKLSEAEAECFELRKAAAAHASKQGQRREKVVTMAEIQSTEMTNHQIRVKADVMVCSYLSKGKSGRVKARALSCLVMGRVQVCSCAPTDTWPTNK